MAVDIQTVAGIAVSVIIFLLSYRQTVGAKKERVRIANNEIQQTIVKRIILESYTPNVADLLRLIDGKARDNRVKSNDLMSITQILNTVFTRIIESDFIASDQREIFLERLNPIIVTVEESPKKEAEIIEIKPIIKLAPQRTLIIPIIGIIASIIGASLSILTDSQEEILALSSETFIVFILSISIITLISIMLKIKESQEETNKISNLDKSFEFEKDVGRLLEKFDVLKPQPYHDQRYGSGYDYYIEIKGEGIIIEVKNWSKIFSVQTLQFTINRLQHVLNSEENVKKAIIVTKNSINYSPEILRGIPVKIMSFKEFKNYLSLKK